MFIVCIQLQQSGMTTGCVVLDDNWWLNAEYKILAHQHHAHINSTVYTHPCVCVSAMKLGFYGIAAVVWIEAAIFRFLILSDIGVSPPLSLRLCHWQLLGRNNNKPFQRKTTCTHNVTRICRSMWCEPTFCNLEWRNWEKSTDDKLYYCRYGYVIISQTNFGYRMLLSTHHLYSLWDTNLSAIRHTNVVEMKFSDRECYATNRLAQIRWWMENRKLMTANCMRLK